MRQLRTVDDRQLVIQASAACVSRTELWDEPLLGVAGKRMPTGLPCDPEKSPGPLCDSTSALQMNSLSHDSCQNLGRAGVVAHAFNPRIPALKKQRLEDL